MKYVTLIKRHQAVFAASFLLLVFTCIGTVDVVGQTSGKCKRGTHKSKCMAAKPQPSSKEKKMTDPNVQALTSLPEGEWADAGIQLTNEKGRTGIVFDCADAEIQGGMLIDAKGEFDLAGSYTPIKSDAARGLVAGRAVAARFQGKVGTADMTLKITSADGKFTFGEYTLGKDLIVRIRRCS